MNKAFGSSMTGNISGFADQLKLRECSLSFTVDDGFHFDDDSYFRVLHQVEPPEVLDITDKIITNHKFYDLILTWNERVLSSCPKARFLAEGVCSWISRKGPSMYVPPDPSTKSFTVSMITSNKTFCPGHQLRVNIYHSLPESFGDLKVVKHMSPPFWPDKRTIIEPYQFSIAVENASHNNWFADKIVDCFIAKTVPLYWGCPNLGNFFNLDGVIRFESVEDLMQKLQGLTPEDYIKRLAAVEDNYQRALKYVHTWDRIEEEIDKELARKKTENLEHAAVEQGAPPEGPRRRILRPLKPTQ